MTIKYDFVGLLARIALVFMRPLARFMPADFRNNLEQFARFLVVGGMNTGLSYIIYVVTLNLFTISHGLALFIGYVGGAVFAFFSFGALVFGGQLTLPRLIRFIVGYIVLYLINWGLLTGLIRLGLGEELAQFLLLPVVAAISFLINRLFVFRQPVAKAP